MTPPSKTKNKQLETTTEKLQNALNKIKTDNLKPSQALLSKLSGVSRRNINAPSYSWFNKELKRLKQQWKDKKNNNKDNIVNFEPIEIKLKAEINNYRKQNSEYFYTINDLQQKILRLEKENLLILRERDELKIENSDLRFELKQLKNTPEVKVINLRRD